MGSSMVPLLLMVVAVFIMVILLRRHQYRSTSGRQMAREHFARIKDQNKLRDSMDQLLVQLEEVARDVGAQVDTRFVKLETVIRDADERVARLSALLEQAERSELAPSHVAPPSRSRRASRADAEDAGTILDRPYRAKSDPIEPPPPEPVDPLVKPVYDLTDAGASPITVAEKLGMTLGEVELILNLRRYR